MALSDPRRLLAAPYGVFPSSRLEELAGRLREEGVQELVVGVPLKLSGSEGEMARRAREVGRKVGSLLGVPVRYFDERLTTREAERILVGAGLSRRRRREVVDRLAAALLLQAYLDRRRA